MFWRKFVNNCAEGGGINQQTKSQLSSSISRVFNHKVALAFNCSDWRLCRILLISRSGNTRRRKKSSFFFRKKVPSIAPVEKSAIHCHQTTLFSRIWWTAHTSSLWPWHPHFQWTYICAGLVKRKWENPHQKASHWTDFNGPPTPSTGKWKQRDYHPNQWKPTPTHNGFRHASGSCYDVVWPQMFPTTELRRGAYYLLTNNVLFNSKSTLIFYIKI